MNLIEPGAMTHEIVKPLKTKTYIVKFNEMTELDPMDMEPVVKDTVFLNGVPLHKYPKNVQKSYILDNDLEYGKNEVPGTSSFILQPSFTDSVDGVTRVRGKIVTAMVTIERMLEIHHAGGTIYLSDKTLLEVCSALTVAIRRLDDAFDTSEAMASKEYILEFYNAVLEHRESELKKAAKVNIPSRNVNNRVLDNRKRKYESDSKMVMTMRERRAQ